MGFLDYLQPIGSTIGGLIGSFYGGPVGGMIGSRAGSQAGADISNVAKGDRPWTDIITPPEMRQQEQLPQPYVLDPTLGQRMERASLQNLQGASSLFTPVPNYSIPNQSSETFWDLLNGPTGQGTSNNASVSNFGQTAMPTNNPTGNGGGTNISDIINKIGLTVGAMAAGSQGDVGYLPRIQEAQARTDIAKREEQRRQQETDMQMKVQKLGIFQHLISLADWASKQSDDVKKEFIPLFRQMGESTGIQSLPGNSNFFDSMINSPGHLQIIKDTYGSLADNPENAKALMEAHNRDPQSVPRVAMRIAVGIAKEKLARGEELTPDELANIPENIKPSLKIDTQQTQQAKQIAQLHAVPTEVQKTYGTKDFESALEKANLGPIAQHEARQAHGQALAQQHTALSEQLQTAAALRSANAAAQSAAAAALEAELKRAHLQLLQHQIENPPTDTTTMAPVTDQQRKAAGTVLNAIVGTDAFKKLKAGSPEQKKMIDDALAAQGLMLAPGADWKNLPKTLIGGNIDVTALPVVQIPRTGRGRGIPAAVSPTGQSADFNAALQNLLNPPTR